MVAIWIALVLDTPRRLPVRFSTAILGEIFLLGNRPAEVEPLLRKALDDQGGNPRLLGSLAKCLRRSDHLAEAPHSDS
jgi:hypothetical protein